MNIRLFGKMINLKIISCLSLLVAIMLCVIQTAWANQYVSIVLVGATGDLAKKYLWRGMFETYKLGVYNKGPYYLFYGGARANKTQGEDALMKIIDRSVTCYNMQCESHKRRFITVIRYVQLKSEEDYENLSHQMALDEETHSPERPIAGRVFYLSTPPVTYNKAALYLYKHCRSLVANSWLRLVLEKPFGSDRRTADALASSLSQWFSENEIYRVDHYLQKSVVKQILPFRFENQNWLEPLMNRHHVERVEIVSKEYIGVKGRTKFYNQVGVLRDMLQNHLTELLTLVAMELPSQVGLENTAEIQQKKLSLLEKIKPIDSKTILFGQYKDYMQEAEKDGINKSSSAKTPTFSAALLSIQSARWKGVPFLLVAGKQMDERTTYVRIIFRNNKFKIPSPTDSERLRQIVFHIGYGAMKEPCIIVSRNIGEALWPPEVESKLWAQDPAYGSEMSTYQIGVPTTNTEPYSQVIQDVIDGKKCNFVGTNQLLSMWDIWQSSLGVLVKRPKLYTRNNSLDFLVVNNQLVFTEEEKVHRMTIRAGKDETKFAQIPSHFLGGTLFVNSTDDVSMHLAMSIIEEASKVIKTKRPFHIGFSGGKTPALLLGKLREYYPLHLWTNTHIWLVDDRCQPLNSHRSNFNLLFNELIQHISIPYVNIHPMPVSIAGTLCSEQDEGDILYEKQLTSSLTSGLDFTVLGLGKDGHIASLFPQEESLRVSTTRKVILTNSANRGDKRMSLTIDFINLSKNIAIMVTGKEKHNILDTISSETDKLKYPVLGVQPTVGRVCWYVDLSAWLGA